MGVYLRSRAYMAWKWKIFKIRGGGETVNFLSDSFSASILPEASISEDPNQTSAAKKVS